MIRPFTFVTLLLAAGSGLYLYQAKQKARVLDQQIEDIRADTRATRQRSEVLRAEYTLLNDPTRLAGLVSDYLPTLKPTQPAQWTSLAELDKRLPPVGDATVTPTPLEPGAPAAAPPAAAAAAPPAQAPVARPTPVATRTQPQTPPQTTPRSLVADAVPMPQRPVLVARAPAPRPVVAPARDAAAVRPPSRGPSAFASRTVAHHHSEPAAWSPSVLAALRAQPRIEAQAEPQAPAPRAAPVAPREPVVASALGMARTMLAPVAITPANAATPSAAQSGSVR